MNDLKPEFEFQKLKILYLENKAIDAKSLYNNLFNKYFNDGKTLKLLAHIQIEINDLNEAIKIYKRILELTPNGKTINRNIGLVYQEIKDYKNALKYLKRDLFINPESSESHFNYGNLQYQTGNTNLAEYHFQRSIELNFTNFEAYNNIGIIYLEKRLYDDAENYFSQTIKVNPNFEIGYSNLATCKYLKNKFKESLRLHEMAISINETYNNIEKLANLQKDYGQVVKSKKTYKRLKKFNKNNDLLKLHIASIAPVIAKSQKEINDYYFNLNETLNNFINQEIKFNFEEIIKLGTFPSSMTMYFDNNNREIKEKYYKLFSNLINTNNFELEKVKQKPKIGFLVTQNHGGIFLKCMKGIIEKINKKYFDIFIICQNPFGKEFLESNINLDGINYIPIPYNLFSSNSIIKSINLDIIFFWEINSDIYNYFLPYFKLARIQCANWGVPETSGIKDIDYFLSSKFIEIENSDLHYTEKLIKFNNLPVFFHKPEYKLTINNKEDFGFNNKDKIYLCIQNLRKISPEMDYLFKEILIKDKKAKIVLINDLNPYITNLLKERLKINLDNLFDRVIFFERLKRIDYFKLISSSDIVLDTTNYTGGINTTFETLFCNIPLVTLPKELHRSRFTYGVYSQMEINDCIVNNLDEYIEKSVEIANNDDLRNFIISKIQSKKEVIFENINFIYEFEDFILNLIT